MAFDARSLDQEKQPGKGVLVTGSAGFIGRELTAQLINRKSQVVALYHLRIPEGSEGVFPFSSDLSNTDLLATPLRGIHTVVHLAWESARQTADSAHTSKPSKNLQMLRNLISAMEKSGTSRLIFISALGACRTVENPFLGEKYLAELMVLNSEIPEKIIIRPATVIGSGLANDRMVQSILNVSRWPGIHPLPSNKDVVSPVILTDLVGITCDFATNPNCLGTPSIVEVEGKEEFNFADLFKLVLKQHSRAGKIPVQGRLGRELMKWMDRGSNTAKSGTKTTELIDIWASQSKVQGMRPDRAPNGHFQSIRELFGQTQKGPDRD